jgi:hypothetical protein
MSATHALNACVLRRNWKWFGFGGVLLCVLMQLMQLGNTLMPSAISFGNPSVVLKDHDDVILSSYASPPSPPEDALTCNSIPEFLSNISEPSEVNKIRRLLIMEHPDCFQNHFVLFAEKFNSRLMKKHVMLHIPKTGGTSVCQSVKEEGNLTNSKTNCWKLSFGPMWCCIDEPKPTTCLTLKSWSEDFLMNENWLDEFCLDHIYSIIVREPVSRAMSNIDHFMRFHNLFPRPRWLPEFQSWRLSLIQSNYMTWSLSAASEIPKQDPMHFVPKEEHLQIAMSRLLKMDHIVDLSNQDEQCTTQTFEFMRIQEITKHSNAAKGNYTDNYNMTSIAAMNTLDIQLYDFATRLLAVDCIFMRMLSERNETAMSPPKN